jgi:hypothetical protein
LLERGLNRVTDTCIPEDEAFRKIEHHLRKRWADASEAGESFCRTNTSTIYSSRTTSQRDIKRTPRLRGCSQPQKQTSRCLSLDGKIRPWATFSQPGALKEWSTNLLWPVESLT